VARDGRHRVHVPGGRPRARPRLPRSRARPGGPGVGHGVEFGARLTRTAWPTVVAPSNSSSGRTPHGSSPLRFGRDWPVTPDGTGCRGEEGSRHGSESPQHWPPASRSRHSGRENSLARSTIAVVSSTNSAGRRTRRSARTGESRYEPGGVGRLGVRLDALRTSTTRCGRGRLGSAVISFSTKPRSVPTAAW